MKKPVRRLSLFPVRKLSMGLFAALLIYILTGFIALPFLIKPVLEEKLSLALTREVKVRKLEINPFSFSFTIKGVAVSGHDRGAFFSMEELFLNLELSSLIRKAAVVSKISVKAPYLRIVQKDEGNYNFSDLMGAGEKGDSGILPFSIGEIGVTMGKIEFEDRYRKQSHTIDRLDLFLSLLSSLPAKSQTETSGSLGFELDNAPVKFNIKAKPFAETVEARVGIDVRGLALPLYMPFYEGLTGLTVSNGTLDLATSFLYRKETTSAKTTLSDGTVRLTGLVLREKGSMEKFLSVPDLFMGGIFIDQGEKRITLGEFSSEKGILNLKRSPDGSLNLGRIISISPSEEINEPARGGQTEMHSPWHIAVDSLRFTDYTVQWEDLVPETPSGITLTGMEIRGDGLSTMDNKKGNLFLGLDWNGSGSIKAAGDLGLNPLFAELKVEAGNIGIDSIQPYFTDRVRIAVTSGDFGTTGLLSVKIKDEQPLVNFRGDASITDFASVDRPYAHGLLDRDPEDFLRWGSLTFSGMDIQFPLLKVGVDKIALSDFYSRIVIYEDGLLNLATIFSQDPEIPEEEESDMVKAQESAPSNSIAIKTVSLENGEIDFSDHLQKPGFSTTLRELTGSLSGLSSIKETSALVSLSGTHGNLAPLAIKGKINPLIENPFADISISFKGIELPSFTPYCARYLGYKLHKGKLDLDLRYRLNDNRITGENKILFDQFTLGDKVESPQATSLPINLGISLLSDSKGRIDIDLPVRGNLDDPEFSFGGMIFKALGNLITKIATAPFAALGSMFGGGAELSHVEFEYGHERIGPAMTDRLDKLASALNNRPGLLLEIKGAADRVMDRKALLEQKFENILKSAKLEEMVKTGQRAASLSQVHILSEEYDSLVKKAFDLSPLQKPLDPSGQPVPLSSAEIKGRMMARIEVPEGDLRELASRRAGAVKAFLSANRKVAPERLFLLEPDWEPAAPDDEKSKNRVNFSMR